MATAPAQPAARLRYLENVLLCRQEGASREQVLNMLSELG